MRTIVSQTPRRRVVAAYDSYDEAQQAVDRLSDRGFPVDKVAIVGRGLRYVEQVTGRVTTGRAALLGALEGALVGAFLGVLVAVIFSYDPNPAVPLLILYGLVAGALVGAALGAILHAATGGRRDFASVPGITAERYEVVVDDDVANRALELLDATA
jgi:heat induced stress protein YflT